MSGILATMRNVLGCDWQAANEVDRGEEDTMIPAMTITQDIGGNNLVLNCVNVHVTIAPDANNLDHAVIDIETMDTDQNEVRVDLDTTVSMNFQGVRIDLANPSLWKGWLQGAVGYLMGMGTVTPPTIRQARRNFAGLGSNIQIDSGELFIYGNWMNPNPTRYPNSRKRQRTAQRIRINNSSIEVTAEDARGVTLEATAENGTYRTYREKTKVDRRGALNLRNVRKKGASTTVIKEIGTVALDSDITAAGRGVVGWRINGTKIKLVPFVSATIQHSNVDNLGNGNLTVLVRGLGFNNTLNIPMRQWIITAVDIRAAINTSMTVGPIINALISLKDQDLTMLQTVGNATANHL
ncbi:hypothetical protein [Aquimarina litoralis]